MTAVIQRPVEPVSDGDLSDQLLNTDIWTDDLVRAAGIPIIDVPFVAVGGGIGTFVTVDYLRVAGVRTDQIRILSNLRHPWQTYEYLATVSQISRNDRIRSDSASCPDNLWGFPSYAVREAFRRGNPLRLLQLLLEPVFTDYYTPKLGHVMTSIEREARRIRYWDMLDRGQVRMVRRRYGGGYFTILTPPQGVAHAKRIAYRSQYVHVAIGYPGLKFLPDLQAYRTMHQDYFRVANAYEDHEQVYSALRNRPGTVLVRGGGIVASRVLERLIQDRRRHGLRTQIIHLFRTYVDSSHGRHMWLRRRGGNGFAYQGFNYPKSVWGGQLKAKVRRLESDDRARVYHDIGGTTTAYRRHWERGLRRGRREGWYRAMTGTLAEICPRPDGLTARVNSDLGLVEVPCDFIIDCTGLEADVAESRVLRDLLEHGNAGRNPLGRMDVERTFEARGTSSGEGKIYITGAATLGGYFPGVDTFLGLQIAAQEVADDLARRKFCKRIGPVRSVVQWLKWATNRTL